MVIGDVSNLPMYYCNTCGNDTLDISERLTASHHKILDIDYVLKISFQVFKFVEKNEIVNKEIHNSQWKVQNTTQFFLCGSIPDFLFGA